MLQQIQVLRPGTTPGVNRLVVVAHHGKPGPFAHQQFYQFVLTSVGILILIHQQVANFALPFGAGFFIHFEQQRGQHDQIIKIQRIVGAQMVLILLIILRKLFFSLTHCLL